MSALAAVASGESRKKPTIDRASNSRSEQQVRIELGLAPRRKAGRRGPETLRLKARHRRSRVFGVGVATLMIGFKMDGGSVIAPQVGAAFAALMHRIPYPTVEAL
jgi:hypothetical protein